MIKYLVLLILLTPKISWAQSVPTLPKNVIIMIGDGMGLSQVSSAFYYQNKKSNFSRFRHVGLINTSSGSHKITDSAAGATAFSTGVRTYNGAVAMSLDTSRIETIFEKYADQKSLGIVATSSVSHATPASFYAHVKSRYEYENIATYLHSSPIDFIAGGGHKFFSQRQDSLNYLDSLISYGFEVDTANLKQSETHSIESKYAYLLASDGLPAAQKRGDFLNDATSIALDFLGQDNRGFILMIEGSQIDWGGHENKADYLINELLDFDKTIGSVLDFVDTNPGTLVIVTADHETGGFTLGADKADGMKGDYNKINPTFSTTGHSATMVPVFAYGSGADTFSGVYRNSDIYHKIFSLLSKNTK
ncbi:MAG: alkaline phosphatase [Cyclobacteriaceae bacterium]